MRRDAGHGDRLAAMDASGGELDAKRASRLGRVVEEHLVKVAHPKEDQRIGLARLGLEVLGHHRAGAGGVGDAGSGNREGRRIHRRRS
jgi:hypothetical protein